MAANANALAERIDELEGYCSRVGKRVRSRRQEECEMKDYRRLLGVSLIRSRYRSGRFFVACAQDGRCSEGSEDLRQSAQFRR